MKEHYHHRDLRNGLIAEGLRLVETAGADMFSLREAARGLDVTANAAYRHFSDKSDLLTAIAAHGFGVLSEHLQLALAAAADEQPPARLRILGKAYVDFALERPELFRLMFGSHGLCQINRMPLTGAGPSADQILNALLDEMVARGHVPDRVRDGALLRVWSAIHGFATLALDGLEDLEIPANRDAALYGMMEFILRGLGVETPA